MKKILFIEDEAILQKALRDILDQEEYQIIEALNGEVGLNLAKNEKLDLILLDFVLPKMHGLEILEQIKKDPNTKDIPIIILTNLESTKDVEKALELGATTYLVKANYSLEEIAIKIKEIINK